jgi:hypothetical protein
MLPFIARKERVQNILGQLLPGQGQRNHEELSTSPSEACVLLYMTSKVFFLSFFWN